ncbi:hypothetical protein [Muribaculum sp.]|uniref:hypothetical protein n=1 Tax=Muribaculum sp. TaxID=1918611 RepID=UPI00257AF5D4|nr:hypothetical protein [Muribaculum sp.]
MSTFFAKRVEHPEKLPDPICTVLFPFEEGLLTSYVAPRSEFRLPTAAWPRALRRAGAAGCKSYFNSGGGGERVVFIACILFVYNIDAKLICRTPG